MAGVRVESGTGERGGKSRGAGGQTVLSLPFNPDLNSTSGDSDMYDLPKKEDALLYQSKGKAGVGWARWHLHPTASGTPLTGRT